MRHVIPVLFLFAMASPLPVYAAVGGPTDMSCVKGDCKKTDPAKEAEKEMNKAAGTDIPIEAPVEGAAPVAEAPTKNPVTPMQANEAIKEIEQAVEKEDVEKKIAGGGASSYAPSHQMTSCAPYAQNQADVGAKIQKNVEDHKIEQKRIADEVTDGWRKHVEDGMRIRQEITDATIEHAKEQQEQMAASADYQRKLKEEGLAIREKLAANVEQHRTEGLALRCLATERFANFSYGKQTP